MKMARTTARAILFALLWLSMPAGITFAEEFTDAIHAYLQQRVEAQNMSGCIVVGIVDAHGSRVISYGTLDNGTDRQADGDTLFNIHSATGTFTHLLLQDMADRRELNLDDPVAKYLPKSVRVPSRNGKQITLRMLAKETSGLPDFYQMLNPKRADDYLAEFGTEQLDALVSASQLTEDPGTSHRHGSVDLPLLAQAMAFQAGADYESVMADRVFGPLGMNSTTFTLTPEIRGRLAYEHFVFGCAVPPLNYGAVKPLAGLYSTANDLLKFISAYGLTPCHLTPEMEEAVTNLSYAPEIEGMFHTGGGGFGARVYAGYDKARRRGVVVLSTADDSGTELGNLLLESQWQSDRRPSQIQLANAKSDLYVGQYQRSPDFALGIFIVRNYLPEISRGVIYSSAGGCLVALLALLWRARSSRGRWITLAGAVAAIGLLSLLAVPISSRIFCSKFQPGIGIRSDGERLIIQSTGSDLCPIEEWKLRRAWGSQSHPVDALFPRIPTLLVPESESTCFERLTGTPITFSGDSAGRVTGLTMQYRDRAFHYEKTSDQPPAAPPPPKRPAIIALDTQHLDAFVGHYVFPHGADDATEIKMTIWREGSQLLAQVWGHNVFKGAIDIYPESETTFFDKIFGLDLTFTRNEKGNVAAAVRHQDGLPDAEGTKQD